MTPIKAISLWQPWASLVALGPDVKPHETRSWWTAYRGPILIHASKRRDAFARDEIARASRTLLDVTGISLSSELPFGAVIATANLVDILAIGGPCGWGEPDHELDRAFGDWSEGRWAWTLENVHPLPTPIVWQGAQGLWSVPEELYELAFGQSFEPHAPLPGQLTLFTEAV